MFFWFFHAFLSIGGAARGREKKERKRKEIINKKCVLGAFTVCACAFVHGHSLQLQTASVCECMCGM